MSQDYCETKYNLEFEFTEKGNTKFLNKKLLKDKSHIKEDDDIFQETNDFSNLNSNFANNINLYFPNTYKSENIALNFEVNTKMMNSYTTFGNQYFNKEELIKENFPTEIKTNNNKINKEETKNIQNNNNENKNIKISYEVYIKYGKRKYQKDNISQKIFKNFNDWIIKKIEKQIPENLKIIILPPNYVIFTHNTNLKDIRFFLDIQIKNIIIMTKNDIESLDELLIIKGIKKVEFRKTCFSNQVFSVYFYVFVCFFVVYSAYIRTI